MALVHIDMSEYKAMEDKAALLERALENEKTLQEEIKSIERSKTKELSEAIKLANDKTIEAYEQSKMKVVKIEEVVTREYVMVKRTDQNVVIQEFLLSLGLDSRQVEQIQEISKRSAPTYSTNRIDSYGRLNYFGTNIDINRLRVALFETEKLVETPSKKSITLHGLDEVKLELKKELEEKLNKAYGDKIKLAEEALEKNHEMTKERNKLTKELLALEESIKSITATADGISKEADDYRKHAEKIIETLQTDLSKDNVKLNKFSHLSDILEKATSLKAKLGFYWTLKKTIKTKTWFD